MIFKHILYFSRSKTPSKFPSLTLGPLPVSGKPPQPYLTMRAGHEAHKEGYESEAVTSRTMEELEKRPETDASGMSLLPDIWNMKLETKQITKFNIVGRVNQNTIDKSKCLGTSDLRVTH